MTASEIIKKLSPEARASLAGVPGYPVKVGTVVMSGGQRVNKIDRELQALGVTGAMFGLTIKGAVVADKIKAESEPF